MMTFALFFTHSIFLSIGFLSGAVWGRIDWRKTDETEEVRYVDTRD